MAIERNPDWAKHPVRTAVAGAGVAGYSWVAGGIASFTTAATVAVAVPWFALAVIAFRWPPEKIPPPERLDIAGASYWAVAAMMFFEWEAAGLQGRFAVVASDPQRCHGPAARLSRGQERCLRGLAACRVGTDQEVTGR